MSYPRTKDEWWQSVNNNWPNLLSILNSFIGMNDHEDIDGNITFEPRSIEVARMVSDKDSRLANYFQGAWQNAPDVIGLHEIPGWNILCDLCSESYLLHEDKK